MAIVAWPQQALLPPVDHSQHPIVEVPEGLPLPSLKIHLFPDRMDGFNVFLETENFRFTPQNLGTTIVANEGHAHLYVNGQKVARMYSPWQHLPTGLLDEGLNRLEVEFSANDHSVWGVAGQPIGADVLINTLDDDGDPIVREEVRYTLDWDWEGARRLAGGGWETRSDLGYLVHVTAGRLVTRNIELVPCHSIPGPAPQASLLPTFFGQPAWAGHSSLAPNESKISRSYDEDLADPRRMFLEARVVTDPDYCRAHYLIARARGTRPGELAVEVSGTWIHPREGNRVAFRIQSAAAYGQLLGLSDGTGTSMDRRVIVGGLNVTVRRSLSTMFDGIDLSTPESAGIGMHLIRTLVSRTRFVLSDESTAPDEPGPAPGDQTR